MAPTTVPTHDQPRRAHAIGCAVENLKDAARLRSRHRVEILSSNPITVGDGYLQDGTATCYCGNPNMGWAANWIAVGTLVLNAAAPAPEPEPDTLAADLDAQCRAASLIAIAKLYAVHPDAPPAVAAALVAAVRCDPWAPRDDLMVKAPGHERFHDGGTSSGWAIWWESGPDEWVYSDAVAGAAADTDWFVEPINSWSIGIHLA
jgi:hypothetical protein